VNRGSKRFLLKTVKWFVVPLALVVVGYLFVGPFASDYMNRSAAAENAAKTPK
jgi:hypothetical protein